MSEIRIKRRPPRRLKHSQESYHHAVDNGATDLRRQGWHRIPTAYLERCQFNIDHPLFCPIKGPPLEVRIRNAVEWVGLVLEIGPEGWIIRDPKWRPAQPTHTPLF